MIHIEAYADNATAANLSHVVIRVDLDDIKALPKSARISVYGQAHINFTANGSNGGANETGAKRVKAILRAANKNGIGVVFDQPANVLDETNAPLWGLGMRQLTLAEVTALIG